MTTTQTSMDHHFGPLTTSFNNLDVNNNNNDDSNSTKSNSPIAPTDRSQHSRNSSRASTVSSHTNRISPTTDRPRSRNDTRSSQASARGKLPDAADPEYSYVYVPPLSSLQTTGSNPNLTKGDVERDSMRSNMSGRSVTSNRSGFLEAGQPHPSRPRSTNVLAENQLPRHTSQERMNRQRDRTRSAEWADRGAAVLVRESQNRNGGTSTRVIKKGVKDFQFGRTLGEGSYSTVVAATDRSTLKEYAIKMLDKRHIIKEKKVKYVNIEKNTLNRLGDHPGIVKLYFTFQDETTLYFVLDLAVNGELLGFIKKVDDPRLSTNRSSARLTRNALNTMLH